MAYKKSANQRYLRIRDVLSMMSRDWNVLLIILTVILLVFWNFVTKAGGVTTFIKH